VKADEEAEKKKLGVEIEELTTEKNALQDEKFQLAEQIDKKQDQIIELEKSLQKAVDEVELRKAVVDSMSENLLKHENDSMEMSQKLTMMKNQILEYDRYVGMNRKYGAVKI